MTTSEKDSSASKPLHGLSGFAKPDMLQQEERARVRRLALPDPTQAIAIDQIRIGSLAVPARDERAAVPVEERRVEARFADAGENRLGQQLPEERAHRLRARMESSPAGELCERVRERARRERMCD